MTTDAGDAGFEDAPFANRPVRLRAAGAEDLQIIAALAQDAVFRTGSVHWMPRTRRLVVILHRFRWEDRPVAERERRPFERVQSALTVGDALRLRVRGIDQAASEEVNSLLTMTFDSEDRDGSGGGRLCIACAGGARVVVEVECLNVRLGDLTRPWQTASTAPPRRPD